MKENHWVQAGAVPPLDPIVPGKQNPLSLLIVVLFVLMGLMKGTQNSLIFLFVI